MAPVDYKRLASEWRILLDWCESGQKESLKKACHDDDKTYKNCIGHNKILRTHEDKAEQVRLCRKKVAEYEAKDDKKSSSGSVTHDNSEEVSALKKQVAALLEHHEKVVSDYKDLLDAAKDVKAILTGDIADAIEAAEQAAIEAREDASQADSDSDDSDASDEVFNGLDFISIAEDYVARNDKMFNDHHEKMKKSLDDALEAKKKAVATAFKQSNIIAEKDNELAALKVLNDALSKAIEEAGHAAVKKSAEVLGGTDDEYVESGSEHPEESASEKESSSDEE